MEKFYKFKVQLLLLLLGCAFISCSKDDDDENPPSAENRIEYNGKSYTIKSGAVEDYGVESISDADGSHYNYDFTITDGTFRVASGSFEEVQGASIAMYAELFSPGTTGFETGTFNFIAYDEDLTDDEIVTRYGNKFFFEEAVILTDSNGDGIINQQDQGAIAYATGGTVTVSGSNNNYAIEYDLTLNNGNTAKGNYAGTFQYFDER